MKTPAAWIIALIASGFAPSVMAHSGHGVTAATGIAHYLVEPLHMLAVFVLLAIIAATVWLFRRKAR